MTKSFRDGIDAVLRAPTESKRVPGVVAMATSREGPIYEGAFGVRDLAKNTPMTLDSVFWIASMTKAVTTAAALQMVERGKLALDQPAGEILPALAAPQVLEGFDAAGAPRLRPANGAITLRRLLTHTAGYTYSIWNADTLAYEQFASLPGIISCQDVALTTPLASDPGTRWEYGINIDWAGKMVEKASGQRLDAYLQEHILGPLGMRDTAFRIGPAQRERLVTMHARGPDGALTPMEFEVPQAPEFCMGGGGLYGTAADYLRFVRMILGAGALDGARVLRDETVAEMAQNQIGALDVTMIKTVQPAFSGDAEFFPGLPKKWGLGFMINAADAPTGRSAGSLAWAGLGNTYFWIDPKRGLGGVILMQLLPFADPEAIAAFTAFESGVYGAAARA